MDILKQVAATPNLRWLVPHEATGNQACNIWMQQLYLYWQHVLFNVVVEIKYLH